VGAQRFQRRVTISGVLLHRLSYLHETWPACSGREFKIFLRADFRYLCPKQFGATLNFAFALRPMGRKTLIGHKSSFGIPFWLLLSDELGSGGLKLF